MTLPRFPKSGFQRQEQQQQRRKAKLEPQRWCLSSFTSLLWARGTSVAPVQILVAFTDQDVLRNTIKAELIPLSKNQEDAMQHSHSYSMHPAGTVERPRRHRSRHKDQLHLRTWCVKVLVLRVETLPIKATRRYSWAKTAVCMNPAQTLSPITIVRGASMGYKK
ncbi:hypothetical protein J1614_006273 [Plenodomus biglobosus]|nr:hypothetical protein J1614_006273 [Plenodomus biglobosus]